MVKRVLMVGAGSCQVSGIKRLKALGYEVVAADYNATTLGKEIADYKVLADAFDTKAIEQVVKTFKVDGIMTMGTDQPVLTVSKAAEKTNLYAFLSSETAYAVTNKKKMKSIFRENGLKTPEFAFLASGETFDEVVTFEGPYVLKPVDSQGQRGIVTAGTKKELIDKIDYVKQFSREAFILVEKFYANEEVTVNGWVHSGKVTVIAITDRVTFSPDIRIGVCTAHEYPSKYSDVFGELIEETTRKLCQAFGINEGPIYFQFLIGEDGLYINEIACRLGGAYEDMSIPYATGIDLIDLNIHGIVNPQVYEEKIRQGALVISWSNRLYSTQLFFCRPGKISDMTPADHMKSLPYVLDFGHNYKQGDSIKETENASQRAGYGIVTGESELELANNLKAFYQELKIIDFQGHNLVIEQVRNRKRAY